MMRILLTTTSYQDTPGPHHDLLASSGAEIVCARGPLSEKSMLEYAGDYDAFLCGDDVISQAVIQKALPRLKIIAKYGIGVDKIDVDYATDQGIPVAFTPGVNHTTVAEHCFMLMLALSKKLIEHVEWTKQGLWKRETGNEIGGKTLGIIGLGRIGREMAIRANAFGMKVLAQDIYWPEAFAEEHHITRIENLDRLFSDSDFISLHTNLTAETQGLINSAAIRKMKNSAVLINCGRGELVNADDILAALRENTLGGYGADVLDVEPANADHPLLSAPNCLITPHIGSRTHESVIRQATKATENLLMLLRGESPHAQVNNCLPPKALT
ncbi:MAG: phosphoglycerate dehydrogenase [Puniceicoccaceae bacterium]|nr:phosphoglycerate dehydrogenase [Puniceicoccaceae bacterium]